MGAIGLDIDIAIENHVSTYSAVPLYVVCFLFRVLDNIQILIYEKIVSTEQYIGKH